MVMAHIHFTFILNVVSMNFTSYIFKCAKVVMLVFCTLNSILSSLFTWWLKRRNKQKSHII